MDMHFLHRGRSKVTYKPSWCVVGLLVRARREGGVPKHQSINYFDNLLLIGTTFSVDSTLPLNLPQSRIR